MNISKSIASSRRGQAMDEHEFWSLIARLDWGHEGDDDRVAEPVINSLAAMPREKIAGFQDLLAHKLHALDGRAWAKESGGRIWWGEPASLSADGFLYARCAIVANGRAFYETMTRPSSRARTNITESSVLVRPISPT
jgi:hypothetical protein